MTKSVDPPASQSNEQNYWEWRDARCAEAASQPTCSHLDIATGHPNTVNTLRSTLLEWLLDHHLTFR